MVHRVRCLGHRVVKLEMRKCVKAQLAGLFGAQCEDAGNMRGVVGIAAVFPPRRPGGEGMFTQLTIFGKCQEGFDDRT